MRQKKLAQSVERSEEGERSLRRRLGEEGCLRRQARDDERPWMLCCRRLRATAGEW
jgi:hypothetical protein